MLKQGVPIIQNLKQFLWIFKLWNTSIFSNFKPSVFFLFFFYCSGFCHTLKWNSHGFTCVPHPDPPSHLPLHPIPLGLPSAPLFSNYYLPSTFVIYVGGRFLSLLFLHKYRWDWLLEVVCSRGRWVQNMIKYIKPYEFKNYLTWKWD